jgi:hypothetical protein
LDCVFIASGMHGEALWTNGSLDAAKVDAAVSKDSVRPTFAMQALA